MLLGVTSSHVISEVLSKVTTDWGVTIACVINEHGVMLQNSSNKFDLSGLLDLIKVIPFLGGIVVKLRSYGGVLFTEGQQ